MNDDVLSKEAIDLQLIELFVAIARSRTIAAAARQFNISPSLATRRLAALERALHVRLFQRTTRSLHLTDTGQSVLMWAEGVINGYGDLRDELSRKIAEPEGLIRLAVSDYAASMLLPGFLHGFMARHPRISFDIRTTDHLVNPVDHEFDVSIHSGFMPDSSLIGIPVRPVQRILCASPSYLAQTLRLQHPRDLLDHVCLAHGATENLEWFFKKNGTIIGQKIQHRLCVDSFLALLQMALKGIGIIRISRNVVRAQLADGSLVHLMPEWRCVQPGGELPSMWVIYPNRQLPYRVRAFVGAIQSYLETSLGAQAEEDLTLP